MSNPPTARDLQSARTAAPSSGGLLPAPTGRSIQRSTRRSSRTGRSSYGSALSTDRSWSSVATSRPGTADLDTLNITALKNKLREECEATLEIEEKLASTRAKLVMEGREFIAVAREEAMPAEARGTPRFGKMFCDVTKFYEDFTKGKPNQLIEHNARPMHAHGAINDYSGHAVLYSSH